MSEYFQTMGEDHLLLACVGGPLHGRMQGISQQDIRYRVPFYAAIPVPIAHVIDDNNEIEEIKIRQVRYDITDLHESYLYAGPFLCCETVKDLAHSELIQMQGEVFRAFKLEEDSVNRFDRLFCPRCKGGGTVEEKELEYVEDGVNLLVKELECDLCDGEKSVTIDQLMKAKPLQEIQDDINKYEAEKKLVKDVYEKFKIKKEDKGKIGEIFNGKDGT